MTLPVVDRPGRTRRLLTNFSWLAGGRTTGALLALAATALAARALGAAEFGLVVLIHAAAIMIRQLCNVKTSEAVIRYGVPLAEEGRIGELRGLIIRFAKIDATAAAIAALIGGVILFGFSHRFDLPADLKLPAALYLLVLLFAVTGTAKGTLRLLDRFGALSAQLTIGPALKLAGVGLLFVSPYSGETWLYVLVWGGAYLIEHAYSWWRAYRAFVSYYGNARTKTPDVDRADVRSFLYTVYWQSTLDAAPKQAATLLAGTLLGPAGAALFAFARELAEVLAKPVVLLRQVVFPDLARLWRNDVPRFIRVTWKTGAITAGVGLLVVALSIFAAEPVLIALAGEDFGAAGLLLTLLLVAATIELAGAAFRPASYVMGRARTLLNVQILATAVYLAAFVGMIQIYGMTGIGMAAILSGIVTFVGAGLIVQRGCRARLRGEAQVVAVSEGSGA
jgi:O-antigen/teichoic acid export membrane protein